MAIKHFEKMSVSLVLEGKVKSPEPCLTTRTRFGTAQYIIESAERTL